MNKKRFNLHFHDNIGKPCPTPYVTLLMLMEYAKTDKDERAKIVIDYLDKITSKIEDQLSDK